MAVVTIPAFVHQDCFTCFDALFFQEATRCFGAQLCCSAVKCAGLLLLKQAYPAEVGIATSRSWVVFCVCCRTSLILLCVSTGDSFFTFFT